MRTSSEHDADVALARPAPNRRVIAGELLRFVIVGGTNTLVSYGVYLALLHWLHYEVAYTIGYVIGIAVAYLLNTRFVFRQPMRKRSAARFPLVYAVQFLLSLALLHVAVEVFAVRQWLALGISVVLTMPVTFLMSRMIVRAG